MPGFLALFSVTASLLLALMTAQPALCGEALPDIGSMQLFGTREFRGPLRALTGWTSLIDRAADQTRGFAACDGATADCSAAALSWQMMLERGGQLQGVDRLVWVNRFFNRWPYRMDLEVYGKSDYWASPEEFLSYSGDCEDYSIAKYFALRQLGVPQQQLRIVVLKDAIRNIAHAVLAVAESDKIYILDNLSELVLEDRRYGHYQPQYSVNEQYRWAHIRPAGQLYFK